jgi:hypothetical protein
LLRRADERETRGAADGYSIGKPCNEAGAALRSNPKGRVFFGRIAALRRLA